MDLAKAKEAIKVILYSSASCSARGAGGKVGNTQTHKHKNPHTHKLISNIFNCHPIYVLLHRVRGVREVHKVENTHTHTHTY